MRDFYVWLDRELPVLWDRWAAERPEPLESLKSPGG
jgi:hypothetical protein